ncbi:flagellar hook-basal body complex protein FliE [Virgibacillus halodenitrificans]|uniref:flagellar hook-basal body complex protein FliE n=1 Tax=Virgibacillus halodenitrificans TaxID=1482 RepID=UPI00045D0143|nr:flagellar hook-basal body complex protein FliE [Virgibacillus halodenitrificans]CDQ35850.1 flagellar hook-basal body protein FliE [Virgibacillus halodenitrificans]
MKTIINPMPNSLIPVSQDMKPKISPGKAQANFANSLKSAMNEVNKAQIASDKKTDDLINGKVDDLHEVMITAQKASITLDTTVQIQRKAIDAYNEIMRMQV